MNLITLPHQPLALEPVDAPEACAPCLDEATPCIVYGTEDPLFAQWKQPVERAFGWPLPPCQDLRGFGPWQPCPGGTDLTLTNLTAAAGPPCYAYKSAGGLAASAEVDPLLLTTVAGRRYRAYWTVRAVTAGSAGLTSGADTSPTYDGSGSFEWEWTQDAGTAGDPVTFAADADWLGELLELRVVELGASYEYPGWRPTLDDCSFQAVAPNVQPVTVPGFSLFPGTWYRVAWRVEGQSAAGEYVELRAGPFAPTYTARQEGDGYRVDYFQATAGGALGWYPSSGFDGRLVLELVSITSRDHRAALLDATGAVVRDLTPFLVYELDYVTLAGFKFSLGDDNYDPLPGGCYRVAVNGAGQGGGAGGTRDLVLDPTLSACLGSVLLQNPDLVSPAAEWDYEILDGDPTVDFTTNLVRVTTGFSVNRNQINFDTGGYDFGAATAVTIRWRVVTGTVTAPFRLRWMTPDGAGHVLIDYADAAANTVYEGELVLDPFSDVGQAFPHRAAMQIEAYVVGGNTIEFLTLGAWLEGGCTLCCVTATSGNYTPADLGGLDLDGFRGTIDLALDPTPADCGACLLLELVVDKLRDAYDNEVNVSAVLTVTTPTQTVYSGTLVNPGTLRLPLVLNPTDCALLEAGGWLTLDFTSLSYLRLAEVHLRPCAGGTVLGDFEAVTGCLFHETDPSCDTALLRGECSWPYVAGQVVPVEALGFLWSGYFALTLRAPAYLSPTGGDGDQTLLRYLDGRHRRVAGATGSTWDLVLGGQGVVAHDALLVAVKCEAFTLQRDGHDPVAYQVLDDDYRPNWPRGLPTARADVRLEVTRAENDRRYLRAVYSS